MTKKSNLKTSIKCFEINSIKNAKNGQNWELDKIEDWTKLKIGQDYLAIISWTKLRIGQNWENWTKLKIGQKLLAIMSGQYRCMKNKEKKNQGKICSTNFSIFKNLQNITRPHIVYKTTLTFSSTKKIEKVILKCFYDLSLQFEKLFLEMKVGRMIITKQVLLSSFMARNGLCHWEMQFVKPSRRHRPHAWMWKYSRKTRSRERETKRKRTAAGKSNTGWPSKFWMIFQSSYKVRWGCQFR